MENDPDNWSNSSNKTVDHAPLDLYRAIPVSLLLAFIDFVTIFGNILVIVAVVTTRSLRQITCNYYIVSLAVSDLLLGICVLPFSSVYEILNYWIFPSAFCVIWLSIDVLSCTASILNLLCISIDRYLAISRPLHYHNYSTPKFIYIIIGTAWVLAIFISVAPVFGFENSGGQTDQCKVAASSLFWTLYSSVGSFFLPLIIMLFLYYRIYLVAAKHSKFMKEERERFASFAQQREGDAAVAEGGRNLSLADNGDIPTTPNNHPRVSRVTIQSGGTPQGEYQIFPKDCLQQTSNAKKSTLMKKLRRMSKDKKAAKTLFIVMACFIGCWLPFFTVYLIDGVCKDICNIHQWIFKVFFWLGYCNSTLNPVIYAASSHDFRTAFRKILHCGVNQSNNDQFTGATDYTSTTGNISNNNTIGNGTTLSQAVTQLRHRVAAHLIKSAASTTSIPQQPAPGTTHVTDHRFPPTTTAIGYSGGSYPAVVQQQENRLKPITPPTAGQHHAYEIVNLTLEKKDGNISSGNSVIGTVDDLVLGKINKNMPNSNHSLLSPIVGSTFTLSPEEQTIAPAVTDGQLASPCTDSSVSTTLAVQPTTSGNDLYPAWNKVKTKAKYMVAILAEKMPHYIPQNNPLEVPNHSSTGGGVIQRIIQVADVGISTNDLEIADKGVQTSVSFVDLGLI